MESERMRAERDKQLATYVAGETAYRTAKPITKALIGVFLALARALSKRG